MRVHHLNCGTMHGHGFPQDDGTGGFFKRGHGVIHCLLVDTGDGLTLVDTDWGIGDCTTAAAHHPGSFSREVCKAERRVRVQRPPAPDAALAGRVAGCSAFWPAAGGVAGQGVTAQLASRWDADTEAEAGK